MSNENQKTPEQTTPNKAPQVPSKPDAESTAPDPRQQKPVPAGQEFGQGIPPSPGGGPKK